MTPNAFACGARAAAQPSVAVEEETAAIAPFGKFERQNMPGIYKFNRLCQFIRLSRDRPRLQPLQRLGERLILLIGAGSERLSACFGVQF
jgi:hypothetical protein